MNNKVILHIDFNSYFATVEQQANPRLRGKPIGVTGGDRTERTVLGAASVEAKKYGVKTGMQLWEAKKLCPKIIFVKGDSDKYLSCTKRFLNILKDYSPYLEVFSIDECFLELESSRWNLESSDRNLDSRLLTLATNIKERIKAEVGDWITCSIGISYNKVMAKLAGSLYKPNGLVVIADEKAAMMILDQVALDEICGIGGRIKKRLNNMGVFGFKALRAVPKQSLVAQFGNVYGNTLYNWARGIDYSQIVPFYEREEVKSIGHRHTHYKDTDDPEEIKQILLKITELIARRLREKRLVGKTVSCWFRDTTFNGSGMQLTVFYTDDGLEIFKAAWKIFLQLWNRGKIRMIGASISSLKPTTPANMSLLDDVAQKEIITKALDKINNKFGEFTLQRGILLNSAKILRKPNPYLSDRRFKL